MVSKSKLSQQGVGAGSHYRNRMTSLHPIVFLVVVGLTFDNDGIQQDLKNYLENAYG